MGRSSQTEQYPYKTQAPDRVRITRRHHPLEGIELGVVRDGKSELVVRHPDSLTMRIPRAWTDVDEASAEPRTAPDTQLTVEALRELIDLADALANRVG